MPVIQRDARHAIITLKVRVGDELTSWGLRRVTAVEAAQIAVDLAPLREHGLALARTAGESQEAIKRYEATTAALLAGESAEYNPDDLALINKLMDSQPSADAIDALYSWLVRLLVRVETFNDETGAPIVWADAEAQLRRTIVEGLTHTAASAMVDRALSASRGSAQLVGKSDA